MDELRFSLVVPVFNEADNIAALCAAALHQLPGPYELLICYDFDKDTTLPALKRIPSDEKPTNIRLIKNTLGPGVRYAIEAGMRAALSPLVIVTMADLSDDLSQVHTMVAIADRGTAVICPSRYMQGGQQIGGPPLKNLLSRIAGITLRWFAGVPTCDATNSFKAYRKDYLDTVTIESSAGFCLGMELVVKAHFGGRKVAEIPTTWRDRSAGKSRFKLAKWIPLYLRWYLWALKRRWLGNPALDASSQASGQ
jgi:dolichol-phosphate mannosyltransferase